MFVFPTSYLSNGIMSCYSVVVHNSIIDGQTKETQELSISSEGQVCLLKIKGHVHRITWHIQFPSFSGKGKLTTALLNGG